MVIAGGYGTGRELVEFFLRYGPLGGLLAMLLISTVIWSAVCAASFEFARLHRHFDYRTFFQALLGRWWFLFEICYVLLLMIVLAVIAAAAGSILQEIFGLPYAVGVLGMMAAVGFLVFRGSDTIEKFLTMWSVLLYAAYGIFFLMSLRRFGGDIVDGFTTHPIAEGWITGGVQYAAYNLAVVPAVLFSIRHLTTRREAIGAGILAGPIAIIPGLLFYVAMASQYPAILERDVPANMLLELLGSRTFQIVFQVVLFGTLIETGTGMIHAINERIASVFEERRTAMHPALRPAVALGLLALAAALARFGIKDLIAKGYGGITWGVLAVFVIPVLTLGVWKIRRLAARGGATTAG